MSAAAPNPQKLMILAALGIGAYWFMTQRRAVAMPANGGLPASQYRPSTGTMAGAAVSLLNTILGAPSTSTVPLLGTVDGRSATQWDVTPTGPTGPRFNNPSAYTTSAVDGAAFNPVGVSPYDATANVGYASDDLAAWWN